MIDAINTVWSLIQCNMSKIITRSSLLLDLFVGASSRKMANLRRKWTFLRMVEVDFIYFMVGLSIFSQDKAQRQNLLEKCRPIVSCYSCYSGKQLHPCDVWRPHNEDEDFISVAVNVDSFVVRVKKRCRDETAPIPSIYEREFTSTADCWLWWFCCRYD